MTAWEPSPKARPVLSIADALELVKQLRTPMFAAHVARLLEQHLAERGEPAEMSAGVRVLRRELLESERENDRLRRQVAALRKELGRAS